MKSYTRIATFAAALALAATGLTAQTRDPVIAAPVASLVGDREPSIPFELFRGNRIVLAGSINGIETPMLLDSGAGLTTLDMGFARKLGLSGGQKITAEGTGGRQDAELFQNVTIEAGNLRLSGATVVAIDLDQVAKAIGRPVPVILGRELFVNSVVSLDFRRGQLTLSPAKDFVAPAGATEVRLRRDGTLHYLPIAIGDLPPVDAAFDLGNGGAISLSREYHEANGLFASLPHAIGMTGGVGGLHENRRVTLPKVNIAGFAFEAVPTDLGALPDGPYKGFANVGIQMFRPFKLTMDLGRDRIWLERNGAPAEFPRDRTGIFSLLEGDHFKVLHVSPGSPADKAGLKKGDKLVAIDDVAVGPTFFAGTKADWAKAEAGTRVTLRKADGSVAALTLADYY